MTTKSTTDNGPRTTDKSDWRLYAAAGAAAVAATSAADAAIIYNDPSAKPSVQLKTNTNGPVFSPFSVDGVPFELGIKRLSNGNTFYVKANSNILITSPFHGTALEQFQPGSAIGRKIHTVVTSGSGTTKARDSLGRLGKFTHFSNNHTGFAGFELPSAKGGGYGWIRFEQITGPDGKVDDLEAIDWAYNNAGGGINAGQGVSVPEPSALGLLAMGSAGVLAWRRRRRV
jgi:hypothetical protein